jgi:hypothetical protein
MSEEALKNLSMSLESLSQTVESTLPHLSKQSQVDLDTSAFNIEHEFEKIKSSLNDLRNNMNELKQDISMTLSELDESSSVKEEAPSNDAITNQGSLIDWIKVSNCILSGFSLKHFHSIFYFRVIISDYERSTNRNAMFSLFCFVQFLNMKKIVFGNKISLK